MSLRFHKDSDRVRAGIKQAFASLRSQGYFARMNFWCCQSCAWADVPEAKADRAVFFHRQDNDDLESSGGCMIAWSGDGNLIKSAFEAAGLKVTWDGTPNQRIYVSAPEVQ